MARGIHKLTAGDLRRKEPGLYNDGGGLYLRITAAPDDGVWRSWIGRYAFNGRTRDMGLGTTALTGLAEVRRMWHGELRPLLRQGIEPIEHRKAGRLAQAAATARAMSVDQCIDAYYQAYRATWRSAKHARGWLQTLRTNFSPVIGAMPVAAVERQDVVRALQPYWQRAQTSAHRTALRLENVFDWAIAADYRAGPNPAQWAGGLEHLLPRTKTVADTRHAALPYGELPAFMDRLRAVDRADARALEFLILTAARTGEVRLAAWTEIDIANAAWTIPAHRMKAGKEHKVPLAVPALQLLQALPRTGELIFPGRGGGPMSVVALLRVLASLGYTGITVHGFRSSFRDWAAEMTAFAREIAEQALAHVIGNATEQAYLRGDLLEKRRRLMDAWAGYLARSPPAGIVTPMRRGDRRA